MTKVLDLVSRRLANADAMIFDMDGTLVLGNDAKGGHVALPGAIDLIALLKRKGMPFRVFTNGSAIPPSAYAASLRKAGLDVEDGEMMTPATTAADWFARRGIRRVRFLGMEGAGEPLRSAGIELVGPSEDAGDIEAVFVAWYRDFTFPDLEAACRDVWGGARLTTASNVPFFASKGGRAIGTSYAINAMIRAMTGRKARILGKPSREALRCALRLMGLPARSQSRTVVIGDDPALEMRMANAAGAVSVAVTTGLNGPESFSAAPAAERPNLIVNDLHAIIRGIS